MSYDLLSWRSDSWTIATGPGEVSFTMGDRGVGALKDFRNRRPPHNCFRQIVDDYGGRAMITAWVMGSWSELL